MTEYKSFETIEEAEAHKKKLDDQGPEIFCPLIDRRCDKRCVCRFKAHISKTETQATVYPGGCDNAMFFQKEIAL